jgi:hypothetical protein
LPVAGPGLALLAGVAGAAAAVDAEVAGAEVAEGGAVVGVAGAVVGVGGAVVGVAGAVVGVGGVAGRFAVMLMLVAGDRWALMLLVWLHPAAHKAAARTAAASINARHTRHGLMADPCPRRYPPSGERLPTSSQRGRTGPVTTRRR